MKLTFRGICNDFTTLPVGVLPENAVKFKEPDTAAKLNATMFLFMIPTALVIGLVVIGSVLLHGELRFAFTSPWDFWVGIGLHFLSIAPHELLHAVCFGKNHPVDMYVSPKNWVAFVCSTAPISKRRFILLSLFPNIFLGWIPLLVWAIFPIGGFFGLVLFTAAMCNTLSGAGDYMNVFNAARQMPKGSMHQHSGMNSFWYMP
jgi:predicted small secreted protein